MRNFLWVMLAVVSLRMSASVHADFSADKFSGCPPLLVNFTNASNPSNATLGWDFNNGNTSSLTNPSAVFNNPGTYRVKLVVTDGTLRDSVVKTITVYRLPQVDFQAERTTICEDDTARFLQNVSAGDAAITDYGWGFGDGTASNLTNPKHVYSQAGPFNVTLVVQDANGCSANNTKTGYINVLAKPHAAFTASPAISCNASQLVSFTNGSTGSGLSYSWNLHDGATSTATNPTYTYSQEAKTIMLAVMNNNGCTDTAYQDVSVGNVIADFTSERQACTGEEILFVNNSNRAGASLWEFGDGTTSTNTNPIKVYNTPGTYTVKLTQTNGPCSNTVVKTAWITVTQGFSLSFAVGNPTQDCASNQGSVVNFTNNTPGGASFYWDFGDGTHSTDQNPTHTYNGNAQYIGSFTMTDANGCTIKSTFTRTVSSFLPVPSFRGDTLSCPGGAVYFHNSSQGAYSYKWYFGDGDTSRWANPTHFYQQPGYYTITMVATNWGGCDSSLTKVGYVHVKEVVTDFSVNQTFSPCPPFVTVFSSTASRNDLKYTWDFGDETNDTSANPTHIYFHPGIFTVSMITETPNGCIDTVTYPHLIEVQGPRGTFSALPTSGCIPLTVAFEAEISSNTKNMWCDLGDGTLVTDSLRFNHTYNTVNSFHPKFILVDHVGCTVPYELPAIVTHALPEFAVYDTLICQASTIGVSLGNDKYQWTPSSFLSCDTCASVNIIPQTTTTYSITATNEFGCQTTKSMTVYSDSLPVLTDKPVAVCLNSSVNLFAGSAFSMQWSPDTFLSDSTIANPVCTPLQSTTYHVTAANSLGCTVSTDIPVSVIEKMELNDMADTTICSYDPIQLNTVLAVRPDADVKYTWSPASFHLEPDNPNPTITGLSRTTTFQVIVSSGTCIPDTASVTVNVLSLPQMEVSEGLTTSPMAEVPLFASSRQDLSYQWTSADSLSCADCRRTNVYPTHSQFVYVTGTDASGCKVTDSVKIAVMQCDPNSVFLPNIFSPNNDGLNDQFLIRSKVLTSLFYFRVFDQWGQLVFETKNLNEGWDGTINGQPAPVAVYACSLGGQCNNGFDVTKSGNITLIR